MRSILHVLRAPFAVVCGLAVAGGALVAVAPAAQAAAFTVTNTNDSGAGSLRQAIIDANSSDGEDVIDFAIGEGARTVQLTTAETALQALPPITEAVTIDATTQPGYVSTPLIQVLEQAAPSSRTAFTVEASGVGIYGLSLVGFGTGVHLASTSSDSEVIDSFFGVNLAGDAVQGQQFAVGVRVEGGTGHLVADNHIANAEWGIWVSGSGVDGPPRTISGNRIGIGISNNDPLPVTEGIRLDGGASAVTVSGNSVVGHPESLFGIRLDQTGGLISVTGNRIGFGADDFPSYPGRLGGGIVLQDAASSPTVDDNQIFGGFGTGLLVQAISNPVAGGASGNVISGNAGAGISVSGGPLARFQLGGNQIYSNDGLGIDVTPAGVNSVPDAGPTIDSITPGSAGSNSITMTYSGPSSSAGADVNIFLTNNSECDPSGFGEGLGQLGSSPISRTLDAEGDFFTTFPVDDTIEPGDLVTAMLSSAEVPSTEFSNCYTVPGEPANTPPVASDTSAVAQENDFVVVQLEGFDADDDVLTFAAESVSAQGGSVSEAGNVGCNAANDCTAEVSYTAPVDFVGDDSFTYTVSDADSTSSPATVTIDVQGGGAENMAPEAYPTSAETAEGTSVAIQVTGFDAEGAVLDFFAGATSEEGGSIGNAQNRSCGLEGLCTAEFTYTPPSGYTGEDSFTFVVVDDAENASEPATVTIDVQGAVNTPPVALDQTLEGVQGGDPVVFELQGLDADGDSLTFNVPDQSTQGGDVSLRGDVQCSGDGRCSTEASYTPPAEFSGEDTFTFTVTDDEATSSPATVTIDVQAAEPQADLSMLSLSDLPDPVTAGGVVAYQAQVRNLGPGSATGVTVDFFDPETNALPPGTTFLSGSVSSSAGGGGTCSQSEEVDPVVCTLGAVPASATTTWTATVNLQTSGQTPAAIDVRARVQGDQDDPVADNQLTETTTIAPLADDAVTEVVPPSDQTETVATAGTVLVGGQAVPIAQPGDTTAAAMSVPPGGPGGVVTVAELDCEPPFCATAPRTTGPRPTGPSIDNRVVQFIPPSASYYDYQQPVSFSITYDRTVVESLLRRKLRVYYTKDSAPDQLMRARWCPRSVSSTTVFPCIDQARILRTRNPQLRGDQLIVLLGTYRDPKIAGFR